MHYPARTNDRLVERFVRPRPRTCWAIKIEERSIKEVRVIANRYGIHLSEPSCFYGMWMVIWPDKAVEFYTDEELDAAFESELR